MEIVRKGREMDEEAHKLIAIREDEMENVENSNADDLAEEVQMQELLFFLPQPQEHEHEHEVLESPQDSGTAIILHENFNCPICMESIPTSDGFNINPCDHIFCISCMIHYITVKTEENAVTIPCPILGCESTFLDPETCQHILPKDTFERWNLTLCESSLGPNKLYCPFKDCSALLIDEEGESEKITNCECPHCNRMFCAKCKVPWHGDMSCEEYERLGEDERGREDLLLRNLAKDKRWQRCPKCRMYVERIDGCHKCSEMAYTSRNMAELNNGEKLNGDNYEIWAMKIQYVLEEQEILLILDHILTEPEKGTTEKHIADIAAYESWKKKNSIACITLLSSMDNNVMREFRQYEIAKEMWLALKQKFGGTSVTKLRQLTIKFDAYKKRPNHSMRQHLREMSNMISELKDAGHVLTDEQQLQAVIRSLPRTWKHTKVNLTHNESIKTLNDAARHLELEEDRIEASKPQETESVMHLVGSSSYGGPSQKRKSNFGHKGKQEKKHKGQDRGKGKASQNNFKKHNIAKIKCFNCGKKGYYARECKEHRKTQGQQTM